MEKIKEKPTLGECVKEKAVFVPKELLRKGLDDGSERLRTQLRDTAQQGRRDEYGGDAIEDTAASGLRRAEKELLKQRKKKNAEQSASPQGDASAPSSNSDVPPVIRTREAEAARVSTPPPPAQEQARQAAMKQTVKTKNAYISAQGETAVTSAPESQRQGQQTFIQEQGRKASRQQAQRRQAEQRFRRQDDLRGDPLHSEDCTSLGREPTGKVRVKERGSVQLPKKYQPPEPKAPEHTAGIMPKVRESGKSAVSSAEQAVRSSTVHATAAGTHAAREAAVQMAKRQQMTKAAETAVQKTAQAAGRALRSIIAAAQSLLAAIAEDVYLAYSQADRRERYVREEQFSGKILSLEQMAEDDLLPDYVGAEAAPSAEEEALEREQEQSLAEWKEMLLLAMLSLNDADRELINALFFDGASTRDYAARIGITQRAVIKRRDRILRDLKKCFENFSN